MGYQSRYQEACAVIAAVHADLPPDADEAQRLKAIDAAYPFGQRKFWPYKMWLKARREYIARHSSAPAGPLFERPHLSPLDRQRLRANVMLSGRELRRRGA